MQMEIYGTDVHGTIVVTTDGKQYSIEVEREGKVEVEPDDMEEAEPAPDPLPERVNVNTADVEDLQRIVHIGEERAEKVKKHRPYQTLEDLTRIRGIGKARVEDIRDQGIAYVD